MKEKKLRKLARRGVLEPIGPGAFKVTNVYRGEFDPFAQSKLLEKRKDGDSGPRKTPVSGR